MLGFILNKILINIDLIFLKDIIAYWFLSLNNDVSTLNNLMNSIEKVKSSPLDRYQISRLIQMSYAKDFKTFCIDSLKKALEAISEISRCGEGKPI